MAVCPSLGSMHHGCMPPAAELVSGAPSEPTDDADHTGGNTRPDAPASRRDSGSEEAGKPTWGLVDRGNFVVGQCEVCGFTSPARRARYSAESDMLAHEILCHAALDAHDALHGHAVARSAGPEEEVASGRQRLSAQGRS